MKCISSSALIEGRRRTHRRMNEMQRGTTPSVDGSAAKEIE